MKEMDIDKMPMREFSFFCEFQVAFELQKQEWEVYQPLIDRYIDLIAEKDGSYRTIQVKSSRVENIESIGKDGYESFGFTMKPKDLFHDGRHFYIWVFVDRMGRYNYFILNIKDFIDVRYYKLPKSSRRKHPSLLMRGEWRWGTDRMHPHHFLATGKWEIEGVEINEYENKWQKIELEPQKSYADECIKAPELNNKWKGVNNEILKKWKVNNQQAKEILHQYHEAYQSSQKLLKEIREEEPGIVDAHLLRLSEEDANKVFRFTEEKWEVFLPLKSTEHILIFRPICSNCKEYWDTSLKECFYCKTKYLRIKVCGKCNRPYPENVKPTQKCECGGSIIKKCIICGEVEAKRKRVFVPITFCPHCGCRENEFEFKKIELKGN